MQGNQGPHWRLDQVFFIPRKGSGATGKGDIQACHHTVNGEVMAQNTVWFPLCPFQSQPLFPASFHLRVSSRSITVH